MDGPRPLPCPNLPPRARGPLPRSLQPIPLRAPVIIPARLAPHRSVLPPHAETDASPMCLRCLQASRRGDVSSIHSCCAMR